MLSPEPFTLIKQSLDEGVKVAIEAHNNHKPPGYDEIQPPLYYSKEFGCFHNMTFGHKKLKTF